MELSAIGLLTCAAAIHALWNLLAKNSVNKQVFLWLVSVAVVPLFLAPVILWYQPIAPIGWALVAVSGTLQAAYTLVLGRAYQSADLSLVYPVARGSAILFVTVFAALALGEAIAGLSVLGSVLVVAGIAVAHSGQFERGKLVASVRGSISWWALLTGVVIASYSTVDKLGVQYVDPFIYVYLGQLVSGALIAPWMVLKRRAEVLIEVRHGLWRIIVVAVMTIGAYGLVLFTMRTNNVSAVASVREMSVVFGALLGALVLREPFGREKIAGAVLIFLGVVAIALSRA